MIALAGNKCDLEENRQIPRDEAEEYAAENNLLFMETSAKMALNALPIPTKYGQECLMAPEEIAEVMVFLASDSARGVNGNIMFVDGGTDALLNSEKVY